MAEFSTAYIYPVTKLAQVSGGDMIMLANIVRDDQNKHVAINLAAIAGYYHNNLNSHCARTRNTRYVEWSAPQRLFY